jgi:hypothetical protein
VIPDLSRVAVDTEHPRDFAVLLGVQRVDMCCLLSSYEALLPTRLILPDITVSPTAHLSFSVFPYD